jgi:F0F1-type ATP synthase assembly protein I
MPEGIFLIVSSKFINKIQRFKKTEIPMKLETPKAAVIYFLLLLGLGGLLVLGLYPWSHAISKGAAYGWGICFLVDLFFFLQLFFHKGKKPSIFLRKFFRAEMQKIVLFVLLMAFVLRYIRADFFGLLLGLILGLIFSRFLAAL